MSEVESLVRRLHRFVGDAIQTEQRRRRDAAESALSGADERQYARSVIAQVLRSEAERRLRDDEPRLGEDVEDEIADAIFARMFGAGRLQRLLDDESIENIDINGADEVWIARVGQEYAERADPVAASDEDLVELVQTLASYAGLSSRAFDSANPELDLQLPDGSRLSAVMSVSARPAISIRRHRFQQLTLKDLIALDTMTDDVAAFLAAVVRARFTVVIAGGTNSGKTTLLRAMASAIDPRERVITV